MKEAAKPLSRADFIFHLVSYLPKIMASLAIIIAMLLFYQPISSLVDRATKFGLGPISIEAAEQKLGKLKESNDKATGNIPLNDDEIAELLGRYDKISESGKIKNLLWVDDTPGNNKDLVDFLDVAGFRVDVVRNTQSALERMRERTYEVVVSDNGRENDVSQVKDVEGNIISDAGTELAREIHEEHCGIGFVLFSGSRASEGNPTPPYVSMMTNRYYQVLLYIAEIASRPPTPC